MLIKTTHGFYLCEILQESKILLRNHKKLIDEINGFEVARYASEVIVVSKDLAKIRTMKILSDPLSEKIPMTNPLLNPGNQCIGGYSEEDGCLAGNLPSLTTNNYENQNYKLEQLNDGIYHKYPTNGFSD